MPIQISNERPRFVLPIDEVMRHATQCVRECTELLDDWHDMLMSKKDIELKCPSCTYPECCYNVVLVSIPEALVIGSHLISSPRTLAMDNMALAMSLWDQGTRQDAMCGNYLQDKEKFDQGCGEWQDKREMCVLLKDGECSIRHIAPAMCRAYYVFAGEDCLGKRIKQVDSSMIIDPIYKAHHKFSELVFGMSAVIAHRPLGMQVRLACELLATAIKEENQ
jgi:hypothetical protein